MKKTLVLLISLLAMAGCQKPESEKPATYVADVDSFWATTEVSAWIDPKTNREWLVFRGINGALFVVERNKTGHD